MAGCCLQRAQSRDLGPAGQQWRGAGGDHGGGCLGQGALCPGERPHPAAGDAAHLYLQPCLASSSLNSSHSKLVCMQGHHSSGFWGYG